MPQNLELRLDVNRGVPVLHVQGELDLLSAPDLRSRGRELVDAAFAGDGAGQDVDLSGPEQHFPPMVLVLDATDVDYIDSAGLGAVIDVLKCVRAHRAGFSIAGGSTQLHNLLARTGLNRVIALHTSPGDAVDAAAGPGA